MKIKFYRLSKILKENATYNVIIGQRSDGKTFACLEYAVQEFIKNGSQFAMIRRNDEDYLKSRGERMFENLVKEGVIERETKGQWNTVTFSGRKWYLAKRDNELDNLVISENPLGYALSLSGMEHDKSSSFPNVKTVIFDEFVSRSGYLRDEFVIFMNCLSTIIRNRDDVKIFMLGNTVNKYCPYFGEMGLTHVEKMEKGKLDVYYYGESGLIVAVEFTDTQNKNKPSDKYFAFDNPKLQMITGGAWELDIYPHCPCDYSKKDILFIYFIVFNGNTLQCEIIQKNTNIFTFIHEKTTEIKNERDIVYSLEYSSNVYHKRKITKPTNELEKKIASFFIKEKVFYQNNEIGEVVRNYLMACGKSV